MCLHGVWFHIVVFTDLFVPDLIWHQNLYIHTHDNSDTYVSKAYTQTHVFMHTHTHTHTPAHTCTQHSTCTLAHTHQHMLGHTHVITNTT
jgi:hypothetical protein